MCEKYSLDHYSKELTEQQMQEKEKKKLIKGIEKNVRRNFTFTCLTRHIGKGGKGSLKKLHEVNQNLEIVKTHVLKEEIESITFAHNTKHHTADHDAAVYNDEINGQV